MENRESTRNKIIEVAAELFLTKGYEKTKISDIINGLDGLTKGAIYHYFDSKEAIFNAVIDGIGSRNIQIFDEIKDDSHLNGAEKLSKIVKSSFENENMGTITEMAPNLVNNPKLLSAFISEIRDVTIPQYLQPIINEGIADGSIKSDYPNELAEMIAILLNMWLNPLIFQSNEVKLSNKLKVINEIVEKFNIKLFEDNLIHKIED